MRIRMIHDGRTEEVEDCWGERLIEQGKAVPTGAETKTAKAQVTVTDRVPSAEKEKPNGNEAPRKTERKR